MKFSRYLRGNGIHRQDRPIFFDKELGHTKLYLDIEQMRFNKLLVRYDIATLLRLTSVALSCASHWQYRTAEVIRDGEVEQTMVEDVVASEIMGPGDNREFSLKQGDYFLQVTAIGSTSGKVTVNIHFGGHLR